MYIFRLTFGFCMLKNFRRQFWEDVLWIFAIVIFVIVLIFAIFWNIFYTGYSITEYDNLVQAAEELRKIISALNEY